MRERLLSSMTMYPATVLVKYSLMSHSHRLSQFVTRLTLADIPEDVIVRAKLHLLDTLGVALAGSVQPHAVNTANAIAAMPGSKGNCRIWGRERYAFSAPYAALANGIASHVLDYDDTHTDSILHGSAVIAPVVFALAEELKLGGRDLLCAFVCGWEVAARIGACAKGSFHERGFHSTAIAGVFGATVAAAKLLKLDVKQTMNALGLAGSQASGVAEYLSNGSASKCFHAGWSAHSGILAAHLACAGVTGPETIFEGRYGLYVTHGKAELADIDGVSADLGTRWELMRVSIKPFPCCHFGHAFISCALDLRTDGVEPKDVVAIDCVVDPIEVALICEPLNEKYAPKTPYEAKFSLPFMVAAALTDGLVNARTFTPDSIARADVLSLAAKVRYRDAHPGETTFPKYFPGWITATLTDGRRIERRLDINYGNPDSPMKEDDLRRKFFENADGVVSLEDAQRLADKIAGLERASVV